MSQLEYANHIVGPRRDDGDGEQDNDARHHAERVQHGRDRENTQADLRLHHQHRRAP